MTSSLTQGAAPKQSGGARLMTFFGSSRLKFSPTAKLQIPVVAALPSTCVVGEICTNAADTNKLYQCTTANTWTKVGTQT